MKERASDSVLAVPKLSVAASAPITAARVPCDAIGASPAEKARNRRPPLLARARRIVIWRIGGRETDQCNAMRNGVPFGLSGNPDVQHTARSCPIGACPRVIDARRWPTHGATAARGL